MKEAEQRHDFPPYLQETYDQASTLDIKSIEERIRTEPSNDRKRMLELVLLEKRSKNPQVQ